MWFHCIPLLFGSCMALRASDAPVSVGVKKYTVELALTLTEPTLNIGRPIVIAVDGAKSLSKIHPTQVGKPIVLHHMSKGSVVTAHVGTHGACAYLVAVTAGPKHCTVGEWELTFASIEENDQGLISEAVYEAYVKIVGWGSLVTIDIDHSTMYTFDAVFQNETQLYAGLHRGALVRVVSNVTGDTCTYRVGNTEVLCHLDGTWGLLLGSVMEIGENDDDESVSHIEDVKHYTVEFALQRDSTSAKQLDIGLNGHGIASKMKATEAGKSIIVHHVKGGSVFTAVGHDTPEACSIYVGAGTGLQTASCAGWTLNVNIHEETGGTFADREEYDLTFFVRRASNETSGTWGLMVNEDGKLVESPEPRMFPGTLSGYKKGTRVRPYVNDVIDTHCAHVTGVDETTSCEYNGWNFTIMSTLNMNNPWDGNNWDFDLDADDDVDPDPEFYEIKVTAIDKSGSPLASTLECIARQDLEFYAVPLGGTSKSINNGTQLFQVKNLTATLTTTEDLITVKTATFVAQFPGGYPLSDGFYCTLYEEEHVKCEADTYGGAWTWDQRFSLEIELNN